MLPLGPLVLFAAGAAVAGPGTARAAAGPGEVVAVAFPGVGLDGRCTVADEVFDTSNRGNGPRLSSTFSTPYYDPAEAGKSFAESLTGYGYVVRPGPGRGVYLVPHKADEAGRVVARVVGVRVTTRNLPPGVGPRVYKVAVPK